MNDSTDTSLSSYESNSISPTRAMYTTSRLSASSNSYQSRSEPTTTPSSNCSKSSSSSSASSGLSIQPENVKRLEAMLGMKTKNQCKLCDKKVINMKSHVKRMHGEDKSVSTVPCGQCDMIVPLSGLPQHVLQYHMETSEADCSVSPPSSLSDVETSIMGSNKQVSPAAKKQTSPIRLRKQSSSVLSSSSSPSLKGQQASVLTEATVSDSDSDSEEFIVPPVKTMKRILPSLSKLFNTEVIVDLNQNSVQVGDTRRPGEIVRSKYRKRKASDISSENVYFWIKTEELDRTGEKVRNVKIMISASKTIRRVKMSYAVKLGLDMEKLEWMQMKVEGRSLEDWEEVGMLNKKTVCAHDLQFKV